MIIDALLLLVILAAVLGLWTWVVCIVWQVVESVLQLGRDDTERRGR